MRVVGAGLLPILWLNIAQAEEGCESFAQQLAQCQPYVCQEINPLNPALTISREIKGEQASLCHYEENFQTQESTASIQCHYTYENRLEKADNHTAMLKGFFEGDGLRDYFFIKDFQQACDSGYPQTTLLDSGEQRQGDAQWF